FLERNHPHFCQITSHLFIENSAPCPKKVYVRNTTHGLLLVQKGKKAIEFDKKLSLHANQALFFPQGNHFANQNSTTYQALAIYFDDSFALDFLKRHSIALNPSTFNPQPLSFDTPRLQTLVDTISSLHYERPKAHKQLLKNYINLLFLELYTLYPSHFTNFFGDILSISEDRAFHILQANLDIIESVEDMCHLLRLSSHALRKLFFNRYGKSPKEWLDEQRMKKAALLLRTSEQSVAQIATECGFATSSWFIERFKKYYQMTPLQYRKENRYF
ncbi:MAG: hypothetical protein C6H99_05830, partial [Epsilonproteobacteria bacterium]|nr:hypothetical protein [Campylobacterota bacterium]NPA64856.1 helix-turn-helix transcriptional regulator [Campylobacterota bacterium]